MRPTYPRATPFFKLSGLALATAIQIRDLSLPAPGGLMLLSPWVDLTHPAKTASQQADDVRQYGMAKEGLIARQFMLGVVQTADGMPIYHEVFAGNTSEAPTLKPTLQKVLSRYPLGLFSVNLCTPKQVKTLAIGCCSNLQLASGITRIPSIRHLVCSAGMHPLGTAARGQWMALACITAMTMRAPCLG